MRVQKTFRVSVFSMTVVLFLVVGVGLRAPAISAQATQQTIRATRAFDAPGCSNVQLGGVDIDLGFGTVHVPSPYRTNPEWKAIILDSSQPANLQPPTILEGFVSPQASDEIAKSQATAEVAEEDLPWTHYTHDFTFKVIPDSPYQHLLSSWVRFPGATLPNEAAQTCSDLGGTLTPPFVINPINGVPISGTCVVPADSCSDGTTCQHTDMEVEWDSASLMGARAVDVKDNEGFQRTWGAVPEFVWPAIGDRVWVEGRWIFDCGHPGDGVGISESYVNYSTEIHPPRALVTFRLNHTALDSFPVARTSAPNFPFPQSYLPVTGCSVGSDCGPATLPPGVQDSGPTNVPVTEADIFVSVNGGAANDLCSITSAPCSGNTGPIIPVNDRNYVFDIYPPGTKYVAPLQADGTFGPFPVTPPVPDASLQWRAVDHFDELPAHACGGADNTVCVTVDPIICLLDSSTPPPDQSETGCPKVPAQPTRLRVILPFCGSNATAQSPGGCTNTNNPNYFAKSILLGWDDVPRGSLQNMSPINVSASLVNGVALQPTPVVRSFKVTLHALTVMQNGEGTFSGGDWRVFVNVGGQWRYISPLFETDDGSIHLFSDNENICNGTALTDNANNDCFVFDNTPWKVSVEDGTPIHVAVGGFVARSVEDSDNSLFMCRNFPGGCAPPEDFDPLDNPFRDFVFGNDDRIGTYEFDLVAPHYAWADAPSFTTRSFDCSIRLVIGACHLQYKVEFQVVEIPAATAPTSGPLGIGTPNFGQFVSSATPLTLSTASTGAQGFQYRFEPNSVPLNLPTYPSTLPFPVHWTHVDLPAGSQSVPVFLTGADGPYFLQYSAESFGDLLEPRHAAALTLDNTPPVISIIQPQATVYPHCGVLTLNYTIDDGTGSGVASFTPTMDGATTLAGVPGLGNGQMIDLLTELNLGTHTFSITATDNVNNTGTTSVTFTIIVTPDSIKCDVAEFVGAGKITVDEGNSLLGILDAAARARAAGDCATANRLYQAFIREVTALSGKKIDPTAAQIMIGDAQYLIAHCP